jgi:methyltransferase (TIGR00027 family)
VIAEAMPAAGMTRWQSSIRTVVIDAFLASAIEEGVDTVLNLGAGLDARPWRITLPGSLLWIEADQPALVDYKEDLLRGEASRCRLEQVRIDLADAASRRRLLADVDVRAGKLLVITEGVIPYLTEEQAGALADDLRALKHLAGWIVDYTSPKAVEYRNRLGMERAMQNAPFHFAPPDPFAFWQARGWRVKTIRYLEEEGQRLGRPAPLPFAARAAIALFGWLAPKERREALRRFSGYMVLEPG